MPPPPPPSKAPGQADPRALALLATLRARQTDLPRGAGLAWERACFAEVLDHPDPRGRIQAFLGEGK